MSSPDPSESDFRVGSAALGLLVGLVLGLLGAGIALAWFSASPSFPRYVFGGGAVGAVVGFILPGPALTAIEGIVHALFGLLGIAGEQIVEPSPHAPLWLKVMLWAGVALGVLLYLL